MLTGAYTCPTLVASSSILEGSAVPIKVRHPIEPTEQWQQLRLLVESREQECYELLRPVVLFGRSPAERARETGFPRRSLYRRVERFDLLGMRSLFEPEPAPSSRRTLPPPLRQLMVDLKAEYPAFHLREIATICYVARDRRPSPHTIQRVLADGPAPSRRGRRYPPYEQIADPAEARLAIIRLHAEGWRVGTIASYLEASRRTVHRTLRACLAMRRSDITPCAARAVVAILCRNGVAIGLEGGPRIPPADAERIVHLGKVMR
jgi:Homeodomain-like domain